MRMIITITALLGAFSAWANSPSGLQVKGFGVDARGNATMTIQIDKANVALNGQMSPSATLASSDGRIIADCSAIGDKKGELCLIHRDGGNGALALFKAAPKGFALVNSNLAATNAGDNLDELVSIVNSHASTPDEAINSLNSALSNSQTIAQVIDAYQRMPSRKTQLSDAGAGPVPPNAGQVPPNGGQFPPNGGRIPPVGGQLPPPVVAPAPGIAAGFQGSHRRHVEHHDYIERHDSIVDTYDNSVNIPVTTEYEFHQGCFDGNCTAYGTPGVVTVPPVGPGGTCCAVTPPVALPPVGPGAPPPGYPTPYGYGGYGAYGAYGYGAAVVVPPAVSTYYRRGLPR